MDFSIEKKALELALSLAWPGKSVCNRAFVTARKCSNSIQLALQSVEGIIVWLEKAEVRAEGLIEIGCGDAGRAQKWLARLEHGTIARLQVNSNSRTCTISTEQSEATLELPCLLVSEDPDLEGHELNTWAFNKAWVYLLEPVSHSNHAVPSRLDQLCSALRAALAATKTALLDARIMLKQYEDDTLVVGTDRYRLHATRVHNTCIAGICDGIQVSKEGAEALLRVLQHGKDQEYACMSVTSDMLLAKTVNTAVAIKIAGRADDYLGWRCCMQYLKPTAKCIIASRLKLLNAIKQLKATRNADIALEVKQGRLFMMAEDAAVNISILSKPEEAWKNEPAYSEVFTVNQRFLLDAVNSIRTPNVQLTRDIAGTILTIASTGKAADNTSFVGLIAGIKP